MFDLCNYYKMFNYFLQIEKFMPLNNQLKTPDNRLITPKIKSLKNRFAPASTKKQLNFDNGSIVLGSEHETYEHLAMKPLDDQRCYETLNNLLATPDDRFITPKIKSIKNQLAPQSAKKQLNFCRVPMEQGDWFRPLRTFVCGNSR